MEKEKLELISKGQIEFMGIKIPILTGGFGKDQKCVLAKDISKIHNTELKEINQSIKRLIDKNRIKENIHYIDLLNENSEVTTGDLEIKTSNGQKSAYLLSERGYFSLIKYMDDDTSWEVHDNFVNNYFQLKEENKELKQYIKTNSRLTDKCLLNLEGKKEDETEFNFLINNAVRNEVERCIEQLGLKAGAIASRAGIRDSYLSQWRTRRTELDIKELESITNIIAKFKELLE